MTARKVGVISYGLGNVGSIRNMLRRIGVLSEVISAPEELHAVDRVILPGIGNFGHGMSLLDQGGWVDAIQDHAGRRGRPLLGICLGMQLLAHRSEEGEGVGLSLIEGDVRQFDTSKMVPALPVPHMGWTAVPPVAGSKLMHNLPDDARFYFVHSLHMKLAQGSTALPIPAHYGYEFTCGVEQGNVFGVQFHPEKSHVFGMALLQNYCDLTC